MTLGEMRITLGIASKLTIGITTHAMVPGAKVFVNVKKFGLTVYSLTLPVCDDKTPCPILGKTWPTQANST